MGIYKETIEEAYSKMIVLEEEHIKPKPDGSEGNVIRYDPSHQSFKQAMIVVVFSGMWLEALFHQEIVRPKSKNQFNNNNKKSYREKLELIGITEASVLNKKEKRVKKKKKKGSGVEMAYV